MHAGTARRVWLLARAIEDDIWREELEAGFIGLLPEVAEDEKMDEGGPSASTPS